MTQIHLPLGTPGGSSLWSCSLPLLPAIPHSRSFLFLLKLWTLNPVSYHSSTHSNLVQGRGTTPHFPDDRGEAQRQGLTQGSTSKVSSPLNAPPTSPPFPSMKAISGLRSHPSHQKLERSMDQSQAWAASFRHAHQPRPLQRR
jgi:hypothetical protein